MSKSSTNQLTVLNALFLFSRSVVPDSATPWTAERQASLSCTLSQSLLKLMSIELVMPSNHLVFCCPLLLLPSIFPSIRVFFSELSLCIRWPKYWKWYLWMCFVKVTALPGRPSFLSCMTLVLLPLRPC